MKRSFFIISVHRNQFAIANYYIYNHGKKNKVNSL